LKQIRHPGNRSVCMAMPMLALLVCAAGCRHRVPQFKIPVGALVPVELEIPSGDAGGGIIATLPLPDLEPFPSTPPAPPVQRRRPAAPREDTQPPAQPAMDAAPAQLAIGNLSTGTDATPQIQQQAEAMISSVFKRIEALSSRTAGSQRRELDRVRNFLKQAQQALNTGDIDGAKNLAVKAGLLVGGLEKK
jgi:hypothetical protein